jgi:hypothetical protein
MQIPRLWIHNQVRKTVKEPIMDTATPAPAITGTVVPAPRKSFIKAFAADFKKVFSFLGNRKVQLAIVAGEKLAEQAVPALALLSPLIDSWTTEIFKVQAISAAASQPDGNGLQKSAAVISTLTPQIVQFAEANKLPTPTGDKLLQANTALYNFLEILGGGEPANAPTA